MNARARARPRSSACRKSILSEKKKNFPSQSTGSTEKNRHLVLHLRNQGEVIGKTGFFFLSILCIMTFHFNS